FGVADNVLILPTAGGIGYNTPPNVTFLNGGGSGATGFAHITTGVGSVGILGGGSGYTGIPAVKFADPPAGGTTATGFAMVDLLNQIVTGVVMTNFGSGYVSTPSVTFSGGTTGQDATGLANLTGTVDHVTVTSPGSGYNSPPTVSFSGGGATTQAAASA